MSKFNKDNSYDPSGFDGMYDPFSSGMRGFDSSGGFDGSFGQGGDFLADTGFDPKPFAQDDFGGGQNNGGFAPSGGFSPYEPAPFGTDSYSSTGSFVGSGAGYDKFGNNSGSSSFDNIYSSTKKKKSSIPLLAALLGLVLVVAAAVVVFAGGKDAVMAPAPVTAAPTQPPVQDSIVQQPVQPSANQSAFTVNYYVRSLLSPADQEVYDRIFAAIMDMTPSVVVEGYSSEDLFRILSYVRMDHPELFWTDGAINAEWIELDGKLTTTLNIRYLFSPEDRANTQKYIDAFVEAGVAPLRGLSQYEQIKGVYEYIINNVEYDRAVSDAIAMGIQPEYSPYSQSIYDLMVTRKAVCTGYAKSMQYMLQLLGIETIVVSGYGTNEYGTQGHAWNIVKMDGRYYQLDATWGDPVTEPGEAPSLNYNYFLITSQEMYRDHSPDEEIPLPSCVSSDGNYFVREGRFFESFNRDRILDLMRRDMQAGRNTVMRFVSKEVYDEAFRILFEEDGIYPMIEECAVPGISSSGISYVYDEEFNILELIYNRV